MKWVIAAALLTMPAVAQAQTSPEEAQARIKWLVEEHWTPLPNVKFEVTGSGCHTRTTRHVLWSTKSDGSYGEGYSRVNDWQWQSAQVDPARGSQVTVRSDSRNNLVFEMDSPSSARRLSETMARLVRYCHGAKDAFARPVAEH